MTPPATAPLSRLSDIVGALHVIEDPAALAAYEVDGMRPSAAVKPASAEEVAEIVRLAAAAKSTLIPAAGRTKLCLGMPPARYDIAVDLSRLNRVLAYDPDDLTLGVEAGIPIARLLEVLEEKKQFVPLLVPFFQRATIGGILSSGSLSPLRYSYGSPRDFVLGIEFVTGDGRQVKSGGRVVKNVAGYDLHKTLLGALGTLGVLTRINFRTFPIPQAQRCFVFSFPSATAVFGLCKAVAKSNLQPRLLEVLDPQAGELVGHGRIPPNRWSAIVAAAGHDQIVERHARELAVLAQQTNAETFTTLTEEVQRELLDHVREFVCHARELSAGGAGVRVSVVPAAMPALLPRLREVADRHAISACALIRATRAIYLVLQPQENEEASGVLLVAAIEEMLRVCGEPEMEAQARIEWCPTEMKRKVNVWGPPRAEWELMKKLKGAFDPHNILSPGRFVGGI